MDLGEIARGRLAAAVYPLALDDAAQAVVVAVGDRVLVLDVKSGRTLEEYSPDEPGLTRCVEHAVLTPDGRHLVLTVSAQLDDEDGYAWVEVFDRRAGKRTMRVPEKRPEYDGGLRSVSVTSDGGGLVTDLWSEAISFWDLATGAFRYTVGEPSDPYRTVMVGDETPVTAVAATPDGDLVAVLRESGELSLLRKDGTPIQSCETTLTGQAGARRRVMSAPATMLAFSRDCQTLMAACQGHASLVYRLDDEAYTLHPVGGPPGSAGATSPVQTPIQLITDARMVCWWPLGTPDPDAQEPPPLLVQDLTAATATRVPLRRAQGAFPRSRLGTVAVSAGGRRLAWATGTLVWVHDVAWV